MPAGRPSEFDPEVAAEICDRIAGGESLRAICEEEDMPSRSGVLKWLASGAHPEFVVQYARAREMSADSDADDVAHYARQAAAGEIEPGAATAAINGLKWSAGKRKPKVYGDKLAHVGGGPDDAPIRMQHDLSGLTDEELEQLERIRGKLGVAEPGANPGGEGEAGD
jgi:hypothetical protein